MNWIQTFSGGVFDLLNPKPEDFKIEDIAHALSLLCRFKGHCKVFYSVAQHSCLVSDWLRDNFGNTLAYQGLMHEGAEPYISDLPGPLKRIWFVRLVLKPIEARIERIFAQEFGVQLPLHPAVKAADLAALATERRDLMRPCKKAWIPLPAPFPDRIEAWDPERAETEFLERFIKLRQALRL